MSTHPIASYTKSTRLFALYQSLPRSEADAVLLTELMQNYGDNPDNYTNERKNLENDPIGVNQLFNDIFYSDALNRVPA